MTIRPHYTALAALLAGMLTPAMTSAHQFYHGLIPLKGSGGKQSATLNTHLSGGSMGGWVTGTRWGGLPSMVVGAPGVPTLYRFHLDHDALVNLTALPNPQPGDSATPKDRNTWYGSDIDPAISLYQGLLPAAAMDSRVFGIGWVDATEYSYGPWASQFIADYWGWLSISAVSPWDAAPYDPAIPHLIGQLDGSGTPVMDPSWGSLLLTVNPDWNDPARPLSVLATEARYQFNANLTSIALTEGDLTPKQWYEKHYSGHNGYRDTLNYTDAGGMVEPGDPIIAASGWAVAGTPGKIVVDQGIQITWWGQMDPIGDFSLTNDRANLHPDSAALESYYACPATAPDCNPAGVDWAKIFHVGHANAHDGETYLGTDGSTLLPAPNLTAERLHNQVLAKGDYTVLVAGGCGICGDEYYGGSNNSPIVDGEYDAGLNLSLQTWPVKDCSLAKNAKSQPEMAPVSGPWDVEAGQTLSIPLGAHACGSNTPMFQADQGLPGATVGEMAPFTAKIGNVVDSNDQPLIVGWQSQLSWTADNVNEVTTRTVKITASVAGQRSKPQKAKVRVWPKGVNPGNSYDLTAPTFSWDGNTGKLSVIAKVQLKNAKALLPEEKAAIYGRPLRMIGNESGTITGLDLGYGRGGPIADSKGKLSYSILLDATAVPCKISWVFGHYTGLNTVANAPGNCVQ